MNKDVIKHLRKFVDSKKSSEEWEKVFLFKDGLDYYAGMNGVGIHVKEIDMFKKPNGNIDYYTPLPKEKLEEAEVTEYPPFVDVFSQFENNKEMYTKVELRDEEKFTAVLESLSKTKAINGQYGAAILDISSGIGDPKSNIMISTYDNELFFSWSYPVEGTLPRIDNYSFNSELMLNILKSIKDLKVDSFNLYYRNDDKLWFEAETQNFFYSYGLSKKLTDLDRGSE